MRFTNFCVMKQVPVPLREVKPAHAIHWHERAETVRVEGAFAVRNSSSDHNGFTERQS